MRSAKVKDILTKQELTHIELLREQMKQTRSPVRIVRNWRMAKKIINTAQERYNQRSTRTRTFQ